MIKAPQHRTKVYDTVKKVIERDLTDPEHEELRSVMIDYVNDQVEPIRNSLGASNKKRHLLAVEIYNIARKRGISEERLKFLEKEMAATDTQ